MLARVCSSAGAAGSVGQRTSIADGVARTHDPAGQLATTLATRLRLRAGSATPVRREIAGNFPLPGSERTLLHAGPMTRPFAAFLLLATLAACDAEGEDRPIDDPIGAAAGGKADGAGHELETLSWSSATNVFPAEIAYDVDTNFDANHCELFVDTFGRGEFTNGGISTRWLQTEIAVPEQEGEILNVGMFVTTVDDGDFVMLGQETNDEVWTTGFTFSSNAGSGVDHDVRAFAFFVDVERTDGRVVRLWQSAGGADFDVEDTFARPGEVEGIGGGTITFAGDDAEIFAQKHACR